jgi:hypothetical protein
MDVVANSYAQVMGTVINFVVFLVLKVTSVTKGRQKLPKDLRPSKLTDMIIHWEPIEEHFLMVQFFDSIIFGGKMQFLIFFSENLSP